MENKPDGWPEDFIRTSFEFYIYENGERVYITDPEDPRLLNVREVYCSESWHRINKGSGPDGK